MKPGSCCAAVVCGSEYSSKTSLGPAAVAPQLSVKRRSLENKQKVRWHMCEGSGDLLFCLQLRQLYSERHNADLSPTVRYAKSRNVTWPLAG